MAIEITNFDDITSAALDFYIRGDALQQAIQDKPLLRDLEAKKKTFPSGKQYITRNVQGSYASSDASFFKGFTQDDTVSYVHPANLLQAKYQWREIHAGITMTLTELKQDGVSVVDSLNGAKTTEHSDRDVSVITDLLQNKLDDMGTSWAIKMNDMLWRDGTQDALAVPGLRSIITDTPTVGVTGGLNRATYNWWRHRAKVGNDALVSSAADQTLTRALRSEVRQLRKFGGKPDTIYAGSSFLDYLEMEVQSKGQYTVEGFANNGKTELGMADITMRGVGRFQYDPTMDDLGLSDKCIFIDSRNLVLMPMEGEDKKTHSPARPYDQYVILRAMTWTGGLVAWMLNCNGIYQAK